MILEFLITMGLEMEMEERKIDQLGNVILVLGN
jgi:hypothetical protein